MTCQAAIWSFLHWLHFSASFSVFQLTEFTLWSWRWFSFHLTYTTYTTTCYHMTKFPWLVSCDNRPSMTTEQNDDSQNMWLKARLNNQPPSSKKDCTRFQLHQWEDVLFFLFYILVNVISFCVAADFHLSMQLRDNTVQYYFVMFHPLNHSTVQVGWKMLAKLGNRNWNYIFMPLCRPWLDALCFRCLSVHLSHSREHEGIWGNFIKFDTNFHLDLTKHIHPWVQVKDWAIT